MLSHPPPSTDAIKFRSGESRHRSPRGGFFGLTGRCLLIWKQPSSPDDSPLQWLLGCFSDVQRFMDRAAAANDGVIVNIA